MLNTTRTKNTRSTYCVNAFVSSAFLLIFLVVIALAISLAKIMHNDLESLLYLKKIKLDTIKERLIIDTFTCNLFNGHDKDFSVADLEVEVYQTDDGYRLLCDDLDLYLDLEGNTVKDYTHGPN